MGKYLNAMKHFFCDRFSRAGTMDPADIPPGQGMIIETAAGKAAVYRDDEGRLHSRSPVCPHMRCLVAWNAEERIWECPCHGSRFNAYGHVIQGPARKNLSDIELAD